MDLSVISFTEKGVHLSEKIAKIWKEERIEIFTKCSAVKVEQAQVRLSFVAEGIGEWTKAQMEARKALLFIGACGIAVRAIAPYITDKLHDSPVLVMDEKGEYVIPILSGHVGGANELARELAKRMEAVPVITTATDCNNKFAIDLFAGKNSLHIVNKDGIAKVSSKILSGQTITMAIESGHMEEKGKKAEEVRLVSYPPKQPVDVVITTAQQPFEAALTLRPKEYVIGMGCRQGKEAEKIEKLIQRKLEEAGISKHQIYALASIDRKKEEEGLLAWSRKAQVPFLTFTAKQLQELSGSFHASTFVREQVGVDNVCERAALKACGEEGRLLYEKHAEDGMTIAIAKREWSVDWNEA